MHERDVAARAVTARASFASPMFRAALVAVAVLHVAHYLATLAQPGLAGLFILDSRVYDEMANAMVSVGFFGGREAFGHAPLYPLWLSLLRRFWLGAPEVVVGLQVMLGIANVALAGVLAGCAFGVRAAAPATVLYGFYGAAVMLETKHMPSTLGVFLVLAALLALVEGRDRKSWVLAWLAGVLLGAGCLVRPNTLLFVPLGALWILWASHRSSRVVAWIRAALFVVGVVLAIAPVSLRNHAITGEWILVSSHGGMTLYQSNNETASGTYSRIPGAPGNPRVLAEQLRVMAEAEQGTSLSISQVDAHWRARALAFVADDPLRALALVARKLRLWLGNDEISTEYVLATEREITPTLWLAPIPFAAILALAVVGAQSAFAARRFAAPAWLMLGFVASNIATIAIFYFSSRYRLPAVPLLCGFGGAGFAVIAERLRARDLGRAGWLAPGLLALVVSLVPVSDEYARYADHQWFNYAIAQADRGDHEAAVASLERALEGMEGQWHVHYALGRAYGNVDRPEDALRQYRRAMELRPQSLGVRRGIEEQSARLKARPSS